MLEHKVNLKTSLPGMKSQEVIAQEREYLATGTKCWETPATCERGEGLWCQDLDGNVFMDWTNGMVGILGHSHPVWMERMREQLGKVIYFNSPDFPHPLQAQLAKALAAMAPGEKPRKVFFSCSGTESIEAALKLARISSRKNLILSFMGAFHGRTSGALSLNASKATHRKDYSAFLNNSFSLPYAYCYRCWYDKSYPQCDLYCVKIMERYFKTLLPPENLAAVIFEPMQGEGGYVIPPPEFFSSLQNLAKKYGFLLIADEVQTCFGKSGKWLAIEHFDCVPDIITLAKGLANGMALGATVFNADLDFPAPGMHSNTFGGQLLSCCSALATKEIIESENILAKVKNQAAQFKEGLSSLQEQFSCLGDVRTLGLLVGLEFVTDRRTKEPAGKLRNAILQECYRQGLLMIPCGESTIRITPALTITQAEVEEGLRILKSAISKCTAEI